ncbi:hypothetical protein [Asanoa siamensis]|uniref:NACHT domain-containing protein n=1 Tax=Asanoa siamensis TaxID=926357 RepID=A0ABQ4CWT9_9ACTN|nr:hypothetical protein [Asanoa siamensis]GIF75750.1 hypothetical protein Asi02nite_52680 [Asanoa siamensis]
MKVTARQTGTATASSGGLANSGVIGTVNLGSAPIARSAYREQIRQIAPAVLLDRDTELAELAAFCAASEPAPSYTWWRAPAWAGKSALMAWFALHPPPGVRVVSFFITARYAGQNDWVAFTDLVMEQLADLLDEPMPAYLTDANRYAHLLGLLNAAAAVCRDGGERLVLLVDGLDEDRGVTAGPDAHSIAALLPEHPPAGMRIVVAGRLNPPVPTDVPARHPLRDVARVRSLKRSAHADGIRHAADRELKRLLRGSSVEQDLLGLLTAAGGGLSAADLAELTGGEEWEVEEQLYAVSGRTFTVRAGRWRAETSVYVLGHEELQQQAIRFLGPTRLDTYRQRLHLWADSYRTREWPQGTPEYLLRGYYRLLDATGDLPRMLACGTDRGRHDRMLDLTGGDAMALAEVRTVQNLFLAHEEPNVASLAVLSVRRGELEGRNAYMPTGLPAAWAAIGLVTRAEQLARSISRPEWRAEAFVGICRVLQDRGHQDLIALAQEAARAADDITLPDSIPSLAAAIAKFGLDDWADRVVREIADPLERARGFAKLAEAAAERGDHQQARRLAEEAETLARNDEDLEDRTVLLIAVARTVFALGDKERAASLTTEVAEAARGIDDPATRARTLPAIGQAVIEMGNREEGRTLIAEAEGAVLLATDARTRQGALKAIIAAAVDVDDEWAERIADGEDTEDLWDHLWICIARSAADSGDFSRTERAASEIGYAHDQTLATRVRDSCRRDKGRPGLGPTPSRSSRARRPRDRRTRCPGQSADRYRGRRRHARR